MWLLHSLHLKTEKDKNAFHTKLWIYDDILKKMRWDTSWWPTVRRSTHKWQFHQYNNDKNAWKVLLMGNSEKFFSKLYSYSHCMSRKLFLFMYNKRLYFFKYLIEDSITFGLKYSRYNIDRVDLNWMYVSYWRGKNTLDFGS